jgi:hypothetical protein
LIQAQYCLQKWKETARENENIIDETMYQLIQKLDYVEGMVIETEDGQYFMVEERIKGIN